MWQNQEATDASCPCKPQKKRKEEIREAAVSLAAAEEISADAAVGALLSELGGILALKEQTTTLTIFFPDGRFTANAQRHTANVAARSDRKPWAWSGF